MKLEYIGKFYGQSKTDAEAITAALSSKGYVVHHRPDAQTQVTVFEEVEKEDKK